MKVLKYKKFDIIEVYWVDSMHDSGWMKENAYDGEDKWMEHSTAGYFFKYSPKSIHIIQSKGMNANHKGNLSIDSVMQIPKVAITKIRKLK